MRLMDKFEVEVKLDKNNIYLVLGSYEITYNCDCEGAGHDHIDRLDVDTIVHVVRDGEVVCSDLSVDALEYNHIEDLVVSQLYHRLEVAA